MASQDRPTEIEGGCLCEAIRYKIVFPQDHMFQDATTTCQCEQCRKQTGALVMYAHTIPLKCITYTTSTSNLAIYRASPSTQRGFCSKCGSTLFWQPEGDDTSILVGTIDKEALQRWGKLLVGTGRHLWVEDAIEGVTDGLEGERWRFNCIGEGAQRME